MSDDFCRVVWDAGLVVAGKGYMNVTGSGVAAIHKGMKPPTSWIISKIEVSLENHARFAQEPVVYLRREGSGAA
ncbi:hypothetical protein F4777DRAFT_573334 [Nemania sp. FL0916]|nr:hypothetical protein F4777DRAFT_573334 [Nemania sp. FL0916]